MADFETSLSDMMLRHQTYLSGLRVGAANDFAHITGDLASELRDLFIKHAPPNLGEWTQRDMTKFVARLRSQLADVFQSSTTDFMGDVRQLISAERSLFQRIFRRDTGFNLAAPTQARVWASTRNAIIPATGQTLQQSITGVRNATLRLFETAVRTGFQDKADSADVLRGIIGNQRANFQDGLMRRVGAWSRSFADTAYTHAAAQTNNLTASRFYRQYQWISIIDEATTEICQDRHKEIFEYGEGPLPPAHYNCRSEIVPINPDKDDDVPTSYAAWLEQQPGEFLNDAFKRGASDLDNIKIVTLDGMRDKLEIILV